MKDDKWSIQISKKFKIILKSFCDDNGYKMNRFVENAILTKISGSIKK
jgi:hypothetical protein